MSDVCWFAGTIIAALAFVAVAYGLHRRGLLERYNLSLYGPFILWKTKKGRHLLRRISRRRGIWIRYGNFSIWITAVAMAAMISLLLWAAFYVTQIRPERAPGPQYIIGLPGVNPIIPLWYGIAALAVAIIIHEGAHGILAMVGRLKVRSLGLVFFIVPIGAFVEPDEDQLKETDKMTRSRLAAAGPATNIIFALACAFIFSYGFIGSLVPVEDGLIVTGVVEDSPASNTNISAGDIIIYIEGMHNGTHIPGVNVRNYDDFHSFMEKTHVNDTVEILIYNGRETFRINLTLADKFEFTELPDDRGKGYIGVYVMPQGTGELKETLEHPVLSAEDLDELRVNLLTYGIMLPFSGMVPFHEPITEVYEVTGPLSGLPEPLFWVMTNTFYWLFWLNLMVGLSNALPALPFDGSYLFKDALDHLMTKIGIAGSRKEEILKKLMYLTTFFIFFLVIWQILGPRVMAFV
jgi:membrane-associated protease RseP (regulator of RpoE activity)